MIVWDFNVIVALTITLSLGVVILGWMFYTPSEGGAGHGPKGALSDREFFRQCGFCGYLYFDYFKKAPAHCPRCGSYDS